MVAKVTKGQIHMQWHHIQMSLADWGSTVCVPSLMLSRTNHHKYYYLCTYTSTKAPRYSLKYQNGGALAVGHSYRGCSGRIETGVKHVKFYIRSFNHLFIHTGLVDISSLGINVVLVRNDCSYISIIR